MTRNPLVVHPDMPAAEARSLMEKEKIGHLPVL
ncbi:MAG: CBS domain-containing protein, partial [Treponema sp.]|nr:CBS domain-containing protein [Treponema sp.]